MRCEARHSRQVAELCLASATHFLIIRTTRTIRPMALCPRHQNEAIDFYKIHLAADKELYQTGEDA